MFKDLLAFVATAVVAAEKTSSVNYVPFNMFRPCLNILLRNTSCWMC